MCQHSPSVENVFAAFCAELRQQLRASPLLDPPLAAALGLLELRSEAHAPMWFKCEITQLAFRSDDMHLALGAGVLLSLWNSRLRSMRLAP
jgi:hypothetical protein